MGDHLTRRRFLQSGLAAAGAATAAGLPAPRTARAGSGTELCTLIDITKCVGCEACVEACREENEDKYPDPSGPMPVMRPTSRVRVADWSSEEKREVTDRLTPYNWLFIQQAEGEHGGEPYSLHIPRRCMHCQNAPCSNLCPFGAAFKQNNGIVRIHSDVCMGGAKCKAVCPWHIPERQSGVGLHLELLPQYAGNGVMYKCDRCFHRVADGEVPACIEACPEDVQEIGPRERIVRKARAIAKRTGGYTYGITENGGTNTVYVSPVPIEELNRVVEKGPGRPHLKPVDDVMEDADHFLKAVLLAPFAGAIGAMIRVLKPGTSTDAGKEAHHED